MRTVLPGKPQAKLQAVSTAQWDGLRLVAYICGSALVILGGPHELIQTIHQDDQEALHALAVDAKTGKIATCGSNEVTIYKPYGRREGVLKWAFQSSFQIPDEHEGTLTLSWGEEEELLVGSSSLRLYQTAEDDTLIWDHKLPKPVKFATFSYDASLVASTGLYDRLVKLWRRQSFGSDDTRFDFTYLPHPTAVTVIHWRSPKEHEHTNDNVLFSICGDSKVRIWAAIDPHRLQTLQLWAEIDMQESIQPRELGVSADAKERYAFIIDSNNFKAATESAVKTITEGDQKEDHALEHLVEVAKTNPEVCVVLDRRGNMSAWGLENIGCKTRKSTDKFNIAHVENVNISFLDDLSPGNNVQFTSFCNQDSISPLTLLVHHFDGRIIWLNGKLDELFDPSPRQERLHGEALWSGHDGSIKNMLRSESGKVLLSRTNNDECLVWKQSHNGSGEALTRSSSLSSPSQIHHSCLLAEGDFVFNVHNDSISVWDSRSSVAEQVTSCTFDVRGRPLWVALLPNSSAGSRTSFVATITSSMEALVWRVELPSDTSLDLGTNGTPILTEMTSSKLGDFDDLAFVSPVNSAGSSPVVSSSPDMFHRYSVIACTNDGVLRAWTHIITMDDRSVHWLLTSTIETNVKNTSLASADSSRKVAIVDREKIGLTIWDLGSARLEFNAIYASSDTIQDLDWSSTPDQQSMLLIGFPYKVLVLAQMRYDYLRAGSAWASIKEIRIRELTSHPIGDSSWLGISDLIIGAGNQLYVYDGGIRTSDDLVSNLRVPLHQHRSLDIADLVTFLNGPLPVFHPQCLSQCILAGKISIVERVIIGLSKALKFFVQGDDVDSYVSLALRDFYSGQEDVLYAAKKEKKSSYTNFEDDTEPENLTEEIAASLDENLSKLEIPQLSNLEQQYLANIIRCVAAAEKYKRSMDIDAMRYLLFFRQHMISQSQQAMKQDAVTWREITWAFHSSSQDLLVDLVSRQFHGRMLWEDARESGMFMWITDLTALRAQFEVIARDEYTKTDEKNPIDCSLYYLALRKKSVLIGLWRMAAWNREQSGTQKLLRNDFSDPRWKTAALKNAYALLGKRRFEYAAAFFLLAGNLQDAVNVLAHQMQDLQLAIAVARVYDGDESPVLRSLLVDEVLPQASHEGNRWLASWAFWILGQRDKAIRACISPIHSLIDSPDTPSQQSKSYLSNEPALIVLYKELRDKTLQKSDMAPKISSREEWESVIQTAMTYDRMGCHLLALDLVRNWRFLEEPKGTTANGIHSPDPRKMARRRSSLKVDGVRSAESPTEGKMKPPGKPAPTVFEEPSSNSLLDSFGF